MKPVTPSTAYLDHATAEIRRRIEEAEVAPGKPPTGEDFPGQGRLWAEIAASVEALAPELNLLLRDLHANPETAFEEHHAQARLSELLHRHGHEAAQGVHGVETSVRAGYATTGYDPARHPTIAIMAEYDALPHIGHACGHNVIAAAGVGAFLAAVDTLRKSDLQGHLVLLGTPAEEGHSGKEYMIRGGALDGVDVALMMHPFSYDIASHVWVGRRNLRVVFEGVAAHASAQPFMGRNALDAASLAYQGLGLLRQQMPPSDRLHATITEGGERPSVIPHRAEMSIYVRSLYTDTLRDLSGRVDEVLEGAALMAGVNVHREWDLHPATLPIRNNQVLAQRWAATQQLRDRHALPAGVVPESLAASTDFGNVSHLVPAIHPMVKIAPTGVALHTEAFAAHAVGDEALRGTVDSAAGLAQVAVDLLAEPTLLAQAKAEFEADGGAFSVATGLAEDR